VKPRASRARAGDIAKEDFMAEKPIMTAKQKKLFEVFKAAISAEQEAQSMYRGAAELCDDEEIRAILLTLSQDETRHEHSLMKLYASYRERFSARE
jgi:rubrerythrin